MPSINELRSRLERAIRRARPLLPDAVAHDIAFHLTDWHVELCALSGLYERPNEHTDQQVDEILTMFLVHAPSHIAAASKLDMDSPVTDVFDVGAVETDKRPR